MLENERRQFMRLLVQTEASITRTASLRQLTVALHDLSACGCAFLTPEELSTGEHIEVRVAGTSPRFEPLARQGRVVRIDTAPDGRNRLVGVVFEQDPDDV